MPVALVAEHQMTTMLLAKRDEVPRLKLQLRGKVERVLVMDAHVVAGAAGRAVGMDPEPVRFQGGPLPRPGRAVDRKRRQMAERRKKSTARSLITPRRHMRADAQAGEEQKCQRGRHGAVWQRTARGRTAVYRSLVYLRSPRTLPRCGGLRAESVRRR